jgi:hypothetical protein
MMYDASQLSEHMDSPRRFGVRAEICRLHLLHHRLVESVSRDPCTAHRQHFEKYISLVG